MDAIIGILTVLVIAWICYRLWIGFKVWVATGNAKDFVSMLGTLVTHVGVPIVEGRKMEFGDFIPAILNSFEDRVSKSLGTGYGVLRDINKNLPLSKLSYGYYISLALRLLGEARDQLPEDSDIKEVIDLAKKLNPYDELGNFAFTANGRSDSLAIASEIALNIFAPDYIRELGKVVKLDSGDELKLKFDPAEVVGYMKKVGAALDFDDDVIDFIAYLRDACSAKDEYSYQHITTDAIKNVLIRGVGDRALALIEDTTEDLQQTVREAGIDLLELNTETDEETRDLIDIVTRYAGSKYYDPLTFMVKVTKTAKRKVDEVAKEKVNEVVDTLVGKKKSKSKTKRTKKKKEEV